MVSTRHGTEDRVRRKEDGRVGLNLGWNRGQGFISKVIGLYG